MKRFFCFLLLLFTISCGDTEHIDLSILDAHVMSAYKFAEMIKHNEKSNAISMMVNYVAPKSAAGGPAPDTLMETLFQSVEKYKLTPVTKWYMTLDTVWSDANDNYLCFWNVFAPFKAKAIGKEPALLRISFEFGDPPDAIYDVEVIPATNVDTGGAMMNILLQRKEQEKLNRIY